MLAYRQPKNVRVPLTFAAMKKALCAVWLLGILSQSSVRLGWVLYYHINKSRIVATLCENRDKPDMHCDGKCYLRKKLESAERVQATESQSESKMPPLPESLRQLAQTPLFPPPAHAWALRPSDRDSEERAVLPPRPMRWPQACPPGIFKPPSC